MDGLDTSVGTPSSEGSGAAVAPAGASAGAVEGQGVGTPAIPADIPALDASAQSADQVDPAVPSDVDGQAVDPEQPGETPAVPQLRAHANTLEGELNAERSRWQEIGGYEQAKADVAMVSSIFAGNPKEFWSSLYDQSPEAATAAVDAFLANWPNYVLSKLQAEGRIPQVNQSQSQPSFQSQAVSQEELSAIDPQYHEVWRTLPASERIRLLESDDLEARDFQLEGYRKAHEHDKALQDHQRRLNEQAEAAERAQKEQLSQRFRDAVWTGLTQQHAEKLKLTGDPAIDGKLTEVFRAYAETALTQDPASQAIVAQLYEAIDKLEGRKAMSLAAPVQAAAWTVMSKVLDPLAQVFNGYRKYLELQRNNGVNRVEPSIPGGDQQQQGQSQLPANAGEFSEENLRQISRRIFGS